MRNIICVNQLNCTIIGIRLAYSIARIHIGVYVPNNILLQSGIHSINALNTDIDRFFVGC